MRTTTKKLRPRVKNARERVGLQGMRWGRWAGAKALGRGSHSLSFKRYLLNKLIFYLLISESQWLVTVI